MNSPLDENRSLISPLILFPTLWIIAAFIGYTRPFESPADWSWIMVAVIAAVPLAFVAGGIVGTTLASATRLDLKRVVRARPERTMKILLLVLLLVGWAELVHQFIKIGGVPLLSSRGNEIRFDQGGPSIVLTNLLTVTAIVAFSRPQRLLSREAAFYLLVGGIAMLGFAAQLSRGSMVLVLVASIFARWLYWGRPDWRMILGAGVAVFLVVVGIFYLRTLQNPYLLFESNLLEGTLPGLPFFLLPLVPFYYALAPNFEVLNSLVNYFPSREAFGAGKFNAIGLDLFIPGTVDLTTLTTQLTPPWITGTVAGPLWADGGLVWVVTGLGLIGLVSVGIFVMASRTGQMGWCLAGGYVIYMTLFGIYQSLWTQQVDWVVVLPLLVIVGFAGGQPKGQSERIDSMFEVPKEAEEKTTALQKVTQPSYKPWLFGALVVLLLLLVSGWVIQRNLPQPLPATNSSVLPPGAPIPKSLMTDGAALLRSEPIYWLDRVASNEVTLKRKVPLRRSREYAVGTIPLITDQGSTFDVASWSNWRDVGLFELDPLRDWLDVTVHPSRAIDGPSERYRVPITLPLGDGLTDFDLGTWSGQETDLFITACGVGAEACRLRVFSGESGFQREIENFGLPLGNLRSNSWTLEIGGPAPPNLFLIHYGPRLDHPEIVVLAARNDFSNVDFKRKLDLPSSVGRNSGFLLGTSDQAPAIYFVERKGSTGRDRVEVIPVGLPLDF